MPKKRLTAAAAAAAVLLTAAGCAEERRLDRDDPGFDEGLGEALGVDTSPIQGTLYVDDLTGVIQARNDCAGARERGAPRRCDDVVQCTAPDLAGGLGQDAEVVVITDPDGRTVVEQARASEVALGRLGVGRPDTARDRGQEVAVPGTCTFNWTAKVDDELADGVYTAAVPDLGVEARFTADDAQRVALRYDP